LASVSVAAPPQALSSRLLSRIAAMVCKSFIVISLSWQLFKKFTPKTSAAPVASTGGVLGYVEFISERSAEAKQEAHFEGA